MVEPEASGKAHWERFATQDPEFYIASQQDTWAQDEFYADGARIVERVGSWIDALERHALAVEIGCGLGRISVHLAQRFERVLATDITSSMIEQARTRGLPDNITLETNDGRLPCADGTADLVFSYNVMQHIPEPAEIGTYLVEVARVLQPAGRGVIQFDAAARPFWRDLAMKLPDPLLPRTHRRFIRRYPLAPARLEGLIADADLRVLDVHSPGSTEHFVLLARR